MNKIDYLENPDVSAFLDYFKELVFAGPGSFCQTYRPKREKVTGRLFSISSFKQAYDEYWWDNLDFEKTQVVLNSLSRHFGKQLGGSEITSTLITSLRILDWGGVVNRHSVRWLVDGHETGTICKAIFRATEILSSEDDSGISEFTDNSPLRSDSATTKIFSLASKESIIYDDRVGAAMARIARAHLENCNAERVPPLMNFMRGSANGKARNPSTHKFKFRGKKAGHLHAQSNIRANWIIQNIVKDKRFNNHFCCRGRSQGYKIRIVESALFMIGYDLTTIERISVPANQQSKKDKARILFVRGRANGATPREIKQAFIDEASLTINGANTYYSNFNNEIW